MGIEDRQDTDELSTDNVTRVLQECEVTLRHLHEKRRLSTDGLQTFVSLSERVREEMERRRDGDRRAAARHSPERRTSR